MVCVQNAEQTGKIKNNIMNISRILLETGVTRQDLLSARRDREIVNARIIIACYLVWQQDFSDTSAGEVVGRHRTSVQHYLSNFEDLYNFDKSFAKLVDKSLKYEPTDKLPITIKSINEQDLRRDSLDTTKKTQRHILASIKKGYNLAEASRKMRIRV